MWPINTETLQLEFFMDAKIPKYAILSHTWEEDEVTFQEFGKASVKFKKGYLKIVNTCNQAREHGFQYAWVDACCIDKTSSDKLTESINSMYARYQQAAICYAYLSDFKSGPHNADNLICCRRFTRGWTLQELIASSDVQFYDKTWEFFGNKASFARRIAWITGINLLVLQGKSKPAECSVSKRMTWAKRRQTSRTKGVAYCLIGIFDINMPLIYGEGVRPFRRLQEEIIKRDNNLTIFAWDNKNIEGVEQTLFSLSPANFLSHISPAKRCKPEFSLTNKGLRFHNFEGLSKLRVESGNQEPKPPEYIMLMGWGGGTHGHYLPWKGWT